MKKLIVINAACGVGKSTVNDALNERGNLKNWLCIDSDELGINWWDYAGTDNENGFTDDCLAKAVSLSGDRDLVFMTCVNPADFFIKVKLPEAVTSTYFIALTCSDEQVAARLRARPAERMCGSDEFIAGQVDYNAWIRRNARKFQLCIDNTDMAVEETAAIIENFINSLA